MTTKEMSRQLKMLDTKYSNIKKSISDLEIDAQEEITSILDAQATIHRKQIVEGKALFAVKDQPVKTPATETY